MTFFVQFAVEQNGNGQNTQSMVADVKHGRKNTRRPLLLPGKITFTWVNEGWKRWWSSHLSCTNSAQTSPRVVNLTVFQVSTTFCCEAFLGGFRASKKHKLYLPASPKTSHLFVEKKKHQIHTLYTSKREHINKQSINISLFNTILCSYIIKFQYILLFKKQTESTTFQ